MEQTTIKSDLAEKSIKFLRNIISNIFIIILSIIVSALIFVAGRNFERYQNQEAISGKKWSLKEVTVGLTPDGFIIYNNETKILEMYDDEIGKFLFYTYASKEANKK